MMKGAIRWALNHIPRSWLQRMASWAVPVAGLLYIGRSRRCPICGRRGRKFMPYGYVTSREETHGGRLIQQEIQRVLAVQYAGFRNVGAELILHPQVCQQYL